MKNLFHLPRFRRIHFNTRLYPFILIFFSIVICIANFTPGTFLSGWDTLHPEFDLKLNFLRTFFGVFRTEQGIGALAAHAHMVELPRIGLLSLFDVVFPLNFLRYAYVFLCLILGPLGMYYFLNKVVIKKSLPSFLGALFYLLNLGTYQTFVVPFEMFTTLYASLPYIFLSLSLLLSDWRKKHLLFFAISILFTSIAAYASTLWYVFFMALLLYFTPLVFLKRKTIPGIIKRYIVALTILLLLNFYWLLPNAYFALTSGTSVPDANINKLFSEDAFLKNKEFGTWDNIILLKSFYFDWGIFDYRTHSFVELTQVFQNHLSNPFITLIGWIFGGFIFAGFLYSIKKFRVYSLSFIFLTLFTLLFLVNDNPPYAPLFRFLQEHVPLFKEALRFPDNKIHNIFIFLVAIYFALSQELIINRLNRLKRPVLKGVFAVLVSLLLIFYMSPAFTGNFIHPSMRVKIPNEYFQLFENLKEKKGRVANFPVHSPWGWVYHNWYEDNEPSFQGAGFLYFGLTSSILERDFDRWNPTNEQYYREVSHALYSKDIPKLKRVIEKYDISSLLVDKSVINPGGDSNALYYEELENLLQTLEAEGFLAKEAQFGFLTLYKVTLSPPHASTVGSVINASSYNGAYHEDTIFAKHGNYITHENDSTQLFFPMSRFIDNESKINNDFLDVANEAIYLTIPTRDYSLSQASFNPTTIPANVITSTTLEGNNTLSVSLYPLTPIFDDTTLIPPIRGEFAVDNNAPLLSVNEKVFRPILSPNPTGIGNAFLTAQENTIALFDTLENVANYPITQTPISFAYCSPTEGENVSVLYETTSLSVTYETSKPLCLYLPLSFISNNTPELISFQFTSNSNQTLSACLSGIQSGQCEVTLPVETIGATKTIRFALSPQQTTNQQIMVRFEPHNSSSLKLESIILTSLPSVSQSVITPDFLTITPPNLFKKVTLPRSVDATYYFTPSNNSKRTNDCKNTKTKAIKDIVNESGNTFYSYESEIGTFCDHVSFPALPHSLSYLVFVKSKHNTGLPMNICITNYTSRKCDLYARLSKHQTPSEDVFFLPSSDINGKGYDVNIESTGIKGTPTSNELYAITFVPMPYELLSQIQTGAAEYSSYDGQISSALSFTPSTFLLQLEGTKALVSLSESYHKGFQMYEIQCRGELGCRIKTLLAPLIGERVTDHYIQNSWKNAWEVSINQNSSYAIIFLPQYLEYIGFLVLLIMLSLLLLSPVKPILTNRLSVSNKYFEDKTSHMKRRVVSLLNN